jgi:ribosomal protein S18 acetylase RimI-like enzyme
MAMHIRTITQKDIDTLYTIGLQEFEGDYWFTRKFLKETLKTAGYHYGIFEGKRLVGAILVKNYDRPKMWIFLFVVDKRYRRQGIGSRLLRLAEKKCSKSYPLLFVDIEDTDTIAKKFYTKHGFKRQAKIKDWFGVNKEAVIYSKRVL